jgi:hypothetical protein
MLPYLLLASLTLAAYWQVRENDFVAYDDPEYITQNPHVKSGLSIEGIGWAWTGVHSYNWHPITWLSHMLDAELFGINPAGHHWTSVLFHTANTLLLFLFLKRATDSYGPSLLVAALFSIHPLHVESVAWASERKDVLGAFFWISALVAYERYARDKDGANYLLCLFLFILGLMSKPMVVTLPLVLLLLDYWPLGRTGRAAGRGLGVMSSTFRLCFEKLPFFLFSAGSCLLTYLIQKGSGAVISLSDLPMLNRMANAAVSYATYVRKMFFPVDLTCLYPHPVHGISMREVLLAVAFLIALSVIVFALFKARPYLIVGWLWYLGTLVPVIGLVQVGAQAFADRYTYIPAIGIYIMVSFTLFEEVRGRTLQKSLVLLPIILVLALLLFRARDQVESWKDTGCLFGRAVQVTGGHYLPRFHLAKWLEEQGRLEAAYDQLREVIDARPDYQTAYHHLGNVASRLGRIEHALAHYSTALDMDPSDHKSHVNMGTLLLRMGRNREAMDHFSEALRVQPTDPIAAGNLAFVLRKLGESANSEPSSQGRN